MATAGVSRQPDRQGFHRRHSSESTHWLIVIALQQFPNQLWWIGMVGCGCDPKLESPLAFQNFTLRVQGGRGCWQS
jgi:hypothetical protein